MSNQMLTPLSTAEYSCGALRALFGARWMSNVALSFEHILKYKFIQALLAARRLLKFGVAKHKNFRGE